MKWISNLFSGYARTVHFVAICALGLALILGGPKVTENAGGIAIAAFYYPFAKLKNSIEGLVGIAEQNAQCERTLIEMTQSLNRLEEMEREIERLRSVLNFDPPPGYDLLQARVLSVSGPVGPVSAVINRGSDDGVEVGMSVINQQGLVGRIVLVFRNVATVELLTDPTHRVAARVAESREMGIVRYRSREGMMLDNFPIQGAVEIGNQVVSSGLGGIYPPGLVIGTVRSVERPPEDPFCRVLLDAAANFNTLEELFILKERRL